MLESGAADQSPWTDWFVANGGARTSDQVLKMQGPGLTIDFSQLASHLYVLDVCYARGTCSDSVPE